MKHTFYINGKTITIDMQLLEELARLIDRLNKLEDIERKLAELDVYFQITKEVNPKLKKLFELVKDDKQLMELVALLVKLMQMEKEFRQNGISKENAKLYNKIREKFSELLEELTSGSSASVNGSW